MNTGSISSIPTERVRAARQPKRPLSRYFFFRHMYMHRRLVSRKRLSVMGASRNMLPGNRQSRVAAKRAVLLSVSSAKSS